MGVITRVAGTGAPGNAGDGGPATEAELVAPAAVAVTADWGFLIADLVSNVVREVSSSSACEDPSRLTVTPGSLRKVHQKLLIWVEIPPKRSVRGSCGGRYRDARGGHTAHRGHRGGRPGIG